MATLPTANELIGSTVTEQQFKTKLKKLVESVDRSYQTLAEANLNIANVAPFTKIEILNDGPNNGLYEWDGQILKKSPNNIIEHGTNLEISVAIVDEDDNRTWLEADGAGMPTGYSSEVIAEKVGPVVLRNGGIEQLVLPGASVAIVDEDDNRTWLEADEAGMPTGYSIECLKELLGMNTDVTLPFKYKSSYQTTEYKLVSGPDITCWGDSMTAGAGGNGTTYPVVLGNLLTAYGSSAKVFNAGVGGETSVTITARQGGNPFVARVVDGVIPATLTPVTITLDQIDGQIVRPLLQGNGAPNYGFTGKLAGVEGTIALVKPNGGSTWDAANYYTFTRKTAGSEVAVNRPETFYLDFANAHLGDIHIVWIGQNGPSTARAISDTKAMIQRMEAANKRFLVVSKPTSTDADDSLFFAEFGRRFVAIRKYLIEFGLGDAGITPTEQDTTDIANGTIPTSLRSDAVHWTAQGYTILANLLFNRIKELGWI